MDALFSALSQYIDFLVLGVLALATLCVPFGMRPLADGWRLLGTLLWERGYGTFVKTGLISGATFALLYFSGYLLNAVGTAFVYPAHVSIINTIATESDAQGDKVLPGSDADTFMGLKYTF